MEIEKILKIERIPNYEFSENGLLRLNMSIKEIYDILQPEPYKFFDELWKRGFIIDAPIIASAADIRDYKELDAKDNSQHTESADYEHGLVNILCNLVYFEEEFIDELTGKHGLKDSLGNVIIPALFDSCKPHLDIISVDALNAVELDGQKWLATKDGSGKLVNTEGFDEIICSCCYAWTRRGNKHGLLDSRTGQTLVPCEMDWMIDRNFGGQILGKGDKIGLLDDFPGSIYNAELYTPIYDAIDLSTGQFCLNGKWGWLLKGGDFIESIPEHIKDTVYISLPLPLDHDYNEFLYEYRRQDADEISGVRKIEQVFTVKPSKRLKTPLLRPEDVMVEISTSVAECFSGINDATVISIPIPHGNPVSVNLSPDKVGKWDVQISWVDNDQMDMAVSRAFPLVHAFHEIVFSEGGIYCAKFELCLQSVDLVLPQRIISALITLKARKPQVMKAAELHYQELIRKFGR